MSLSEQLSVSLLLSIHIDDPIDVVLLEGEEVRRGSVLILSALLLRLCSALLCWISLISSCNNDCQYPF